MGVTCWNCSESYWEQAKSLVQKQNTLSVITIVGIFLNILIYSGFKVRYRLYSRLIIKLIYRNLSSTGSSQFIIILNCMNYQNTSFYCALFYHASQMLLFFFFLFFLNWMQDPPLAKRLTQFIAIPTLLQCSGTKPTVSLRYAYMIEVDKLFI